MAISIIVRLLRARAASRCNNYDERLTSLALRVRRRSAAAGSIPEVHRFVSLDHGLARHPSRHSSAHFTAAFVVSSASCWDGRTSDGVHRKQTRPSTRSLGSACPTRNFLVFCSIVAATLLKFERCRRYSRLQFGHVRNIARVVSSLSLLRTADDAQMTTWTIIILSA